jgi:hypothetical protein
MNNELLPEPKILHSVEPDTEIMSYRDGFRNLIWFVKIESLLMVALSIFVYWYISNVVPHDSYFAVGVAGNKSRLVGLTEPNTNKQTLLAWVSRAATQVMTFGFDDLDERMAQSSQLFSPSGWESFNKAINAGEFLNNVRNFQQIITAIPISTPQIQAEGILEGEYRWVVQVPLAVTVRAGGQKNIYKQTVNLILVKMPTTQNPMGLGIRTWYAIQ